MTAEYVFALPDIGEGLTGAEVVDWYVSVGDRVEEEQPLVDLLTDKATVEIASPVTGVVARLGGAPGETIAVGNELVVFAVERGAHPVPPAAPDPAPASVPDPAPAERPPTRPATGVPAPSAGVSGPRPAVPTVGGARRPLASPAVRRRALEAGIDLADVAGSGPAGRILHEDIDHAASVGAAVHAVPGEDVVSEIPIIGLRRRIAERMSLASARIPHITYVDDVDVTEIESLRSTLNEANEARGDSPKLTFLPFLVRAMVLALRDQPTLNATFDDEAELLHQHSAVHVGLATQTTSGLLVPVVRHAEAQTLWGVASEIGRLADAARRGEATRTELTGSTITITSLGRLGGLVTTPIINHPEVTIVGVNKMEVRPVWNGHAVVPRTMMNLSSSFDHRIVDGVDAATFVGRIKSLLEAPALMFVEGR